MKLIDVTSQFATEDSCLEYIEKMRWPNGEIGCVHCGEIGRVSTINRETEGDNKRKRIYQCLACKKQFSATSGTIFNDTHLPLTKWFVAIALICEAKKGISAKQLERHLGVNYRTAWHLAHRIREAMKDGDFQLTGEVEVDETYIHGKVRRRAWRDRKPRQNDCVMGMVERGGRLKLIPVADSKIKIMQPVIEEHVSKDVETIYTDEHVSYPIALRPKFSGKHKTINHSRTYGIGDIHTNTIENAFSLLKRGIYGSYHKVSIKHLGRYCNEFSYRFNRREAQLQMFDSTLKNLTRGEVLSYKKLTAKEAN
jgi:transposase-like protein